MSILNYKMSKICPIYYLSNHADSCYMNLNNPVNIPVVEAWTKGWAIARGLPAPVKINSYFKIDVNWADQRRRYVFPHLNGEFRDLAKTITEPWIFLKACAPPEAVMAMLPTCWALQPQGYMMTCHRPMTIRKAILPPGYTLDLTERASVLIASIYSASGDVAAMGRLVFVDGYAIYDRIETHFEHRRRGLASIIMLALELKMHERKITKSILVATSEGKVLYETLGWELYSVYTTAVIAGF
jgi:hypothetical protein